MCRASTLCALALLAAACGAPEPPRFYSLDSEFPEAERETIRAAVDGWCESGARSCPEEIGWAERGAFVLVEDLRERGVCDDLPDCVTGGRNTGDRVLIARNRPAPDDLGLLFSVAAHEWGHFCIEGHPVAGGLMAAVHKDDEGTLTVDDEAVSAWKDGCAL